MKPTDKPAWPEKVWLDTIHWNDQSKPPRFFGAQNTIVHVVEPVNSIEYVRADLAHPQFTPEQLQSVMEALGYGYNSILHDYAEAHHSNQTAEAVEYGERATKLEAAIAILKEPK